ncbi:hypothetical protein [Flavobacterium sp.]|jgi:hypothetical protein|uniref:hypothetical protein n=1 Tax=Flavobacterium sp. TaxID=239 RepID=UPI0037C16756
MKKNEFDEFERNSKIRRRNLLPWWIKFFCWLFMFTSVLAIVRVILSYFYIYSDFEFYGLNANDGLLNTLIVFIVFTLHGLTGYSLWFEKGYGIVLAKVDAIFGILVCVYTMFLGYQIGNLTFRLELVLLVLFLIKLIKIKPYWMG